MTDHRTDIAEDLGHEPLAISARAVAIAVAVLFGGMLAALALVGGFAQLLASSQGGEPTVTSPSTTIELPAGVPPVDANQVGSLRELRAREEAFLTEYAWVDRDAGVARVPIQRAMEILARQSALKPQLPDDEPTIE
jgi:hypothetical protein